MQSHTAEPLNRTACFGVCPECFTAPNPWHDGSIDYDPPKREITLSERGIDFEDAALILDGPRIEEQSDAKGEQRWICIGPAPIPGQGLYWQVVWTRRGNTIRIISTRQARRSERKEYHAYQP